MKGGISELRRKDVDTLHRATKGPFTVAEASSVLGIPLTAVRGLLASLYSRGWLSRVRRGLYVTVPLGASTPSQWRVDGWVIAAKVFSPCYVGGSSACEHWSLTEQVFRDVVVFTTRPTRASHLQVQGMPFRVHMTSPDRMFGLTPVWRDGVKTRASNPSRTLVDLLDDPSFGGGIAHVGEVVRNYFESDHRDDATLRDYLGRFGNRSTFKRLGYLLEALEIPADELLAECHRRKSEGLVKLDPAVHARGAILKRWRLRVNVAMGSLAKFAKPEAPTSPSATAARP